MPFFISSAPAAFVYPWQFIAGSWAPRIHLGVDKKTVWNVVVQTSSKHGPKLARYSDCLRKPACKTGPWYNARRLLRCLRSPSFVGVLGMVAAIGMIVPDLFGRFGGYLSPSMDLMLECFLFILMFPVILDLAFTLQVKQHKFYVISFHIFFHVF